MPARLRLPGILLSAHRGLNFSEFLLGWVGGSPRRAILIPSGDHPAGLLGRATVFRPLSSPAHPLFPTPHSSLLSYPMSMSGRGAGFFSPRLARLALDVSRAPRTSTSRECPGTTGPGRGTPPFPPHFCPLLDGTHRRAIRQLLFEPSAHSRCVPLTSRSLDMISSGKCFTS